MKTSKKTNAARILDELHIPYELKTYPVDEDHLDAVHVAREVGLPAGQVFKTLCVRGGQNRHYFCGDSRRRHNGFKKTGPGQQEQTLRTGTFKGTAAADRLYSWGLLALRR